MAQVTMSIPEYLSWGKLCPCCQGPIKVVFITGKNVHIACPKCTWLELACVVYGVEPWEIPLDCELFPVQGPW